MVLISLTSTRMSSRIHFQEMSDAAMGSIAASFAVGAQSDVRGVDRCVECRPMFGAQVHVDGRGVPHARKKPPMGALHMP